MCTMTKQQKLQISGSWTSGIRRILIILPNPTGCRSQEVITELIPISAYGILVLVLKAITGAA